MESITIISKLFELYSAKISALETILRENNPAMYRSYIEKLEEFKRKNADSMQAINSATTH